MVKSTLSLPVQNLIKLIFDIKMLKEIMDNYELDSKNKKIFNKKLNKYRDHKKLYASYYRHRSSFHLTNEEIFNVMYEMIQELFDSSTDKCNFVHRMYSQTENLLDICYNKLHSAIEAISVNTDIFEVIIRYITNSHSRFHDHYTIKVDNIFSVQKQDDNKNLKNYDNKILLWYGTEVHNIAAILCKGWNNSGSNGRSSDFDNSIRFTNIVSKAANNCGTYGKNKNGILLLCEVALGNVMECHQTDNDNRKLVVGKHSILRRGFLSPNNNIVEKIDRDVKVPSGPLVENFNRTNLRHDEFFVYNSDRIKIRYIVTVKFKYCTR
ncbi:poly [ADP-ribose] polymerase-like [Microplitis demolitor]|uniref:poly [ADP-ribose] polymerase-like n=1 Tax=Microplitis demolitor TaxID=69319 RepID=UPI0004CD7C02|nr:poly [ADP-ribose] polymerase-like [Microplitis demolitor]